jgi:hypothetical protein
MPAAVLNCTSLQRDKTIRYDGLFGFCGMHLDNGASTAPKGRAILVIGEFLSHSRQRRQGVRIGRQADAVGHIINPLACAQSRYPHRNVLQHMKRIRRMESLTASVGFHAYYDRREGSSLTFFCRAGRINRRNIVLMFLLTFEQIVTV